MITKRVASVAVAVGLMAAQASLFASSAQAYDHGGRRNFGHQRSYGHAYAGQKYGRNYDAPVRYKRDRTGDAVGALVLGLGALIVGSAIANASRTKRYNYHD